MEAPIEGRQRLTRRRLLLLGFVATSGGLLACRLAPRPEPADSSAPAGAPGGTGTRLSFPLVDQARPPTPAGARAATTSRTRLILPVTSAPPREAALARPAGATPTPVPLPPPERPPILRESKWGIGVYRESNQIFDDLYTSRPGMILLMDPSEGWARRVRACFPRAFIVGRRYRNEASQPLDNPDARGIAFADAVAERAVPLRGVVDAWVSYNEVTGHDDVEGYRLYNRFQVAFAHRLQDVFGIAAVAGNDGSGAVEPADYPRYFADAIRASRYLAVHSYSPLGSYSMREAAEWHALRYRKIHEALDRRGLLGIRMVITESGLGDGWRGRVDESLMADDYAWFTDELEKDRYVIGHASFGVFGNDDRWRAFDLRGTDLLTRLGRHERGAARARSG